MHYLSEKLWFPNIEDASKDGLLAIGGDLSAERLMLAYRSGIFPWFEEEQPILWWSPDPRMVLFPKEFKASKSLNKIIKSDIFKVTYNTAFSEVITNCASVTRKGQNATWINPQMISAYMELHKKGCAISVEVWREDSLVGGIYGIDLPDFKIFAGESMFSKENNASKVGFAYLVSRLLNKNYLLIDCQVHTNHLESMGAREISRNAFLEFLK